jgi:hypothetical protein
MDNHPKCAKVMPDPRHSSDGLAEIQMVYLGLVSGRCLSGLRIESTDQSEILFDDQSVYVPQNGWKFTG